MAGRLTSPPAPSCVSRSSPPPSSPGSVNAGLRDGRRTRLERLPWRRVRPNGVAQGLSLLRPAELGRSRRFYRDVLGLAVFRPGRGLGHDVAPEPPDGA